jgi:hypothetical protein
MFPASIGSLLEWLEDSDITAATAVGWILACALSQDGPR